MAKEEERVEARNVSMYPSDWEFVEQIEQATGAKTSAALRAIVRGYRRVIKDHDAPVIVPENQDQ